MFIGHLQPWKERVRTPHRGGGLGGRVRTGSWAKGEEAELEGGPLGRRPVVKRRRRGSKYCRGRKKEEAAV